MRVIFYSMALIGLLLWSPATALNGAETDDSKTNEHSKNAVQDDGDGHPPAHGPRIGAKGVSKSPEEFKSDLAIFTFVVFLLLMGILWKFAWGPICAALDKREAAIRKDIDDAEQARLKAEAMLVEHAEKLEKVQDEVREIIAEARRDADHTKQEIISEAQKEAEATKVRSISEIERARDAALNELFDVMATQVASATEHVLSRSLNEQDQNRLIEEALSQFSRN